MWHAGSQKRFYILLCYFEIIPPFSNPESTTEFIRKHASCDLQGTSAFYSKSVM